MTSVISVQNLRKTYGRTVAVDDISFDVAEGEIFGFLGPNGAGKTTTVECLQALRSPDSGTIDVLGLNPLHQAQELRRRIGSQLLSFSLFKLLPSYSEISQSGCLITHKAHR